MKVIVVGAGSAGLAAVHTLMQGGAEDTCPEAKDFAGGRTCSVHKQGYTFDLGAQFIFKSYTTFFKLCEEMGSRHNLVTIPYRVGFPATKHGKITPVLVTLNPKEMWQDYMDFLNFRGVPVMAGLQMLPILPTLFGRGKDLCFTDFERMLDLDDENQAEFTLRNGGRRAVEHVLQPLASYMTLGEPEDMGAGYGLALLWNNMNGLKTLNHGVGSLFERLYEHHKQCIRLSTPTQKIVIENRRVKGIETRHGLMEADAVICATTATIALKLMPNLPDCIARPLSTVTYFGCCLVMLALRNRLLPPGWYAVALPRKFGSPMTGFTDSSVKSPYYAPPGGGLIHCFTFGRHTLELNAKSDQEVIEILVNDIQRWISTLPYQPYFTEMLRYHKVVCLAPPGMLKAIDRMRKQHMHAIKGLALAGEYMNMLSAEGALKSGIDAANTILS